MREYIIRRLIYMCLLMFVISIFSFIVIQLPPGDYLTTYISNLEQQLGQSVDEATIKNIRNQYGMDKPMVTQYLLWVRNMLHGDFGRSFEWQKPVGQLISDNLPLTVGLSLLTLIFTYAIAIPIGIYSARHQYSILDYVFSTMGFIGLAVPSFFLALILMFLSNKYFGISAGGLYSTQYIDAPWSVGKFLNMLAHLPLPIIIIGLQGTASILRIMRATLLDELKKPYVVAARARGIKKNTLLYKYPVRVALNPIISTIGSILPGIVSGATVTAIVLDIPTIGSLLYNALLSQDMFLAGACIMMLTLMTVIGTFISDILLVLVDPRIRLVK
jgi:peptide/nickel transport system permease protein